MAGHPGCDTARRCLLHLSRKAPSSSITSQTQILVHLWKSFLVPYSTLIKSYIRYSPVLREPLQLLLQSEVVIVPCPSGLWLITSTALPQRMPTPALRKDQAHHLYRCATWETTSENICQSSFRCRGTRAVTVASCNAGTGWLPCWVLVRFYFLQANCKRSLSKAFEHFPDFSWFSLWQFW